MPSMIRLLAGLAVRLYRAARLPLAVSPPDAGRAAPLNFVNFAKGSPTSGDEPEGFVAHAWAGRADADEGLL